MMAGSDMDSICRSRSRGAADLRDYFLNVGYAFFQLADWDKLARPVRSGHVTGTKYDCFIDQGAEVSSFGAEGNCGGLAMSQIFNPFHQSPVPALIECGLQPQYLDFTIQFGHSSPDFDKFLVD
jgi:hypothetical protein